jgi:hypothetical protein
VTTAKAILLGAGLITATILLTQHSRPGSAQAQAYAISSANTVTFIVRMSDGAVKSCTARMGGITECGGWSSN